MKLFAVREVEPGVRPIRGNMRRHHAQAGIRTLLIAALCLLVGLGLGALWNPHREKSIPVDPETSRAIPPVLSPAPSAPVASAIIPVDPASLAEVKRQIPNFASISLEEGTRVLRESALNDLKASMRDMEGRSKEVQERIARAQESNATAEKEAALRELQRLQAEQVAKLAEISTRSTTQIEAWRQLKESTR